MLASLPGDFFFRRGCGHGYEAVLQRVVGPTTSLENLRSVLSANVCDLAMAVGDVSKKRKEFPG